MIKVIQLILLMLFSSGAYSNCLGSLKDAMAGGCTSSYFLEKGYDMGYEQGRKDRTVKDGRLYICKTYDNNCVGDHCDCDGKLFCSCGYYLKEK